MPQFSTVHRVGHSADNMFDLVADIESYPEFLPLCDELTVRSRREKQGREILVADMAVRYKSIHQRFTTQVVLNRADLEIAVKYIEGPFRRLDNLWRFHAIGSRECDIDFSIDYEFKSKALGMLMGAVFDRAFRRFTTAFEQRADRIYA